MIAASQIAYYSTIVFLRKIKIDNLHPEKKKKNAQIRNIFLKYHAFKRQSIRFFFLFFCFIRPKSEQTIAAPSMDAKKKELKRILLYYYSIHSIDVFMYLYYVALCFHRKPTHFNQPDTPEE